MQLDEISKRIIELLQEDGRMSYATLAQDVGLSEAAVRQRVLRLMDAGVMQIVAVTDPLKLGFAREAMLGVRVDRDAREVATAISAIDEINYVIIGSGQFDVLCEVVAISDDDLLDVIGRVRAIDGVVGVDTSVYLKLMKQTYAWGVR